MVLSEDHILSRLCPSQVRGSDGINSLTAKLSLETNVNIGGEIGSVNEFEVERLKESVKLVICVKEAKH